MKYGAVIWSIVFVLLAAFYIFTQDEESTLPVQKLRTAAAKLVNQSSTSPSSSRTAAPAAVSGEREKEFEKRFAAEAVAVGQLDEYPEATEGRLKEFAVSLNAVEIAKLGLRAIDAKISGDDRFLAAQLVAWNGSSTAVQHLENIALSPIPKGDEREVSFEIAVRSIAIEGLADAGTIDERVRALTNITEKVDNTFLADRSQRSLAYLRIPGVPSPAEQDRQALSQLVGE